MEGILVPLHKGGDASDRGVTLVGYLGKLFCQILKSRLESVEREGIHEKHKEGSGETDRQKINFCSEQHHSTSA